MKGKNNFDIVIVGSGFAGFAAACAAQDAGAENVLIIDKMPTIGGTSVQSRGVICIPGSDEQKKLGIMDDSPELMGKDMLLSGEYYNSKPLVDVLTNETLSVYEYLKSLGAHFSSDISVLGGHSKKRALFLADGLGGAALLSLLVGRFNLKGGRYITECILDDIVFNHDKPEMRATGIKVRTEYNYKEPESGTPALITINKALIIASGGYLADSRFCHTQDPRTTDKPYSGSRGATAEVLKMLMKHGAMPVHISSIQTGALSSPDEQGSGITNQLCDYMKQYGILVNPKTGKRFLNELDNNVNQSIKISNDNPPVLIADRKIRDKVSSSNFLQIPLSADAAKEFRSLRELSSYYGIPFETLKKEINRYNHMVNLSFDKDYGKPMEFTDGVKLNKAPYYGMRLCVKRHYCPGGILINENANIVGTDYKIFSNVFAAGEITGGIHGKNRLGGCSILDALVFGRRAGRNAML